MKELLIKLYNFSFDLLREFSNYSLSLGSHKENRRLLMLLRKLNASSNTSILDVGCGYGRTLLLLQQEGYKPVGIDIKRTL